MYNKYWKVHIDDLYHFNDSSSSQIKTWYVVCREYNNYIFINESNHVYKYCYMPCNEASIDYYQSKNMIYMGIFNLQKNRKEKLKKINGSNL